MIYIKGIFIGLGTVLLGTPLALIFWAFWSAQSKGATISFSPMGLAEHLSHSLAFWILIIVLFTVGFVPAAFFTKR